MMLLGSPEVYRHLQVKVPSRVGLPAGASIRLEWRDDGTITKLVVRGHLLSTAKADFDTLDVDHPPRFERRGRDWFLLFWTGCATCVGQNYMRISPSGLSQKGGFENAWAPHFARDGIVYAYPRHGDDLLPPKMRIKGRPLQEAWRWNGHRQKFILIRRTHLRRMPSIPAWRFRHA